MERVLVIGGNGAGKTTFSLQLSEKTGLPVTHLDQLSWTGHWEERPREEFDAMLMDVLRQPRWIIDGNYGRTIPMRAGFCDTLIFLDVFMPICVYSIIMRVIKNYGKTRPDMSGDCPERIDLQFILHAMKLPGKVRARYRRMISDPEFAHVDFIHLHGRRAAKQFLQHFTQ